MYKTVPKYLDNVCNHDNSKSGEIEIIKGSIINEPIFLRDDLIIFQLDIGHLSPSFTISWLTISQCKINFRNINFRCKIQVTARSTIVAESCSFVPYDNRCECAVEIFANSNGFFRNCTFSKATKTGIAIRDRSEVKFNNCNFEDNSNASILVLDKSRADIEDCQFKSADRFSIYLYRNSIALIKDSRFLSQKGKAIFMLTGSQAHIIHCTFNGCLGGGVSIADSSEIYVSRSKFYDIGSSSIHAMKNSTASVRRCILRKCKGNGVNFEYSTGYVYSCHFNEFDFPAIACFGPKATPVVYNSKLSNCKSIAVVSRDCAAPKFSKLILSNVESHGFSISDFSHTIIEDCILKKIQKSPFCIFNGATPIIQNCIVRYKNNSETLVFQAFTNGKVFFKNNRLISNNNNLLAKVHNFGQVINDEFVSNYICHIDSNSKNNQNTFLKLSEGHLISLDDNSNIKVDERVSSLPNIIIFDDTEDEDEEEDYDIDEEEEEEGGSNEDPKNLSKHKLPPKSSIPKVTHMSFDKPTLPPESIYSTKNSIFISQGPPRLKDIPRPTNLPLPLKEINITNLMETECKIDDDNQLIKSNNNENNNNDPNGKGDSDAATKGHLHLGTCLRCGNGPAINVIIPCGHKVLCDQCATECCPPKPQPGTQPVSIPLSSYTCPLCETPIQKCTEEYVEESCVICLDNKCDTIILPCGHRCICYECATQLWTEKKQCPLCQARVLSFRHMFKIYSDEEKREAAIRFPETPK